MESPAVAEAPSTATSPAPQGTPEVQPQKVANLSLTDKINAKLEQARQKLDAPKTESVPTEEAKSEPVETKTEETAQESADPLEVVSFNGKEAPIAEVLKDAEFEVFANGEFKKVDGIDKLMDMASIGFAATKKVEAAKTVIQKSQEVIREIEASVEQKAQEKANAILNKMLDDVTRGVNPATGKPFQNEAERKGAVDLTNALVDAKGKSATQTVQPLTKEDIQKLVEEAAEKKLQQAEKQKAEQRQQELAAQLAQTAENSLQKEITPLMQYFTGEDGKTLNSRLFNSFKNDVRAEADKLFKADGGKTDSKSVSTYIAKASKSVLQEYLPSLKTQKINESVKVPVTSTTSGLVNQTSKPVGKQNVLKMIEDKVKQFQAAQGQR
jgi:hypothetical protein